jgi:mRNA interferase RelE/StbE
MPKIEFSEHFLKLFAGLPVVIQDKVKKQIRLLAENPRHPSLHSKPILGAKGIYEARVDQNYRITYERLEDDTLLLRVVAQHDQAIKNP